MADSRLTTTINRRAALAAAPAAMAFAGSAGASALNPDADLLELGRLRAMLIADEEAEEAEWHRRLDLVDATIPPFPDVLLTAPKDINGVVYQSGGERMTGLDVAEFRRLRDDFLAHPSFNGPSHLAYIERANEVIEAWETWTARNDAVHVETGAREQGVLLDEIVAAIDVIEARIINLRATTISGLRIKAEVAKRHHIGGDHDSIGALIADLTEDA